jgi:hypothetical protein
MMSMTVDMLKLFFKAGSYIDVWRVHPVATGTVLLVGLGTAER